MYILEGKKLDTLKKTVANYGGIFELFENSLLIIIDDEIFFANKTIYQSVLDEKINEKILAIGTQIGKIQKGNFFLGIESQLIMNSSSKKVKLNEKGASLFLYGRDVFIKNILNKPKKGFVIVSNIKDEIIGFGKFDGKMLINILDRGSYLRNLE